MSALLKNAESIFEAAKSAASLDNATNWSILVSPDGSIHMVADSQWTLESLRMQNTAAMAYRVDRSGGTLKVEAQSGSQKCTLESARPDRFLLKQLATPDRHHAET
jgi:hypothetical protein